ncbi:hypothetical protein, unknown function [Leishmania braziliensis MHOM/BR/75/M2904]|uniref:Uncharacterized protein n=2 Tax=Leishmania braziliensis TaxID=5660 RepID=A4H5Z0_LEIBR|nr:hypothetical protein, unknown function [Leishmania braziliensis MHOM/BR/75/M2904]KAI5685944.1 hypothetical protein MNV84_01231 [Leishmania braziliensis]CAJ2467671.1 unnamed protein product [Leishmania braziliensis]CAJ2468278.1 unnamed protein product [Leishmania braziliensis]CAM37210.1 hypothetical protein, unknown function [Leishmania braziliensis MHOM/BR/75/M2904]SYZ63384.1 hypothetical_protein [Leishmania braziliensis MHOM/BR/75/M2904]
MSKECDFFSDSYGCIVTKSIGYQAPFPLVRLSNGQSTRTPDGAYVQGSCFVSFGADQTTSRGRLLTLDVSVRSSSVSFLQLLSSSCPPLVLDPDVDYVSKIEAIETAFAVVTRGRGNRWSTSVYVQGDGEQVTACPRRAHFRRTSAVSLLGSAVWLVEAAKYDPGTHAVHRYSLATALAGGVSESTLVSGDLGRPLDVIAFSEDSALVLSTKGVALTDRRQRASDILFFSALLNGGVTGDRQLLTFDEDYTLRAYDLRDVSAPLCEATSASYLRIKSAIGTRASLLVASDMTGVFDVLHMTTIAALQHSGDTVLDAAVLPSRHNGVRVCTSTGSGMVYDWTVV